jgi:hypothetical protein
MGNPFWNADMTKACTVALMLLLAGCSSGGSDGAASSWNAIRGSTGCNAVSGGCTNLDAVADGNLGTFAEVSGLSSTMVSTVRGIGGAQFPTGSNAGAFITPPSGFSSADLTLTTLLEQENTAVESATGPTLTVTPTSGDPATDYVSFTATAPFNGLRVTLNASGSYLVYELCGDGIAR